MERKKERTWQPPLHRGIKSIGWKAKSMPIVFWSVQADKWEHDPMVVNGMSAEVLLPNGQIVVVDEVRYQGLSSGEHRWQGSMSMSGKASAGHNAFNCVACGTDRCQLPDRKKLF